jgi:SAM-dependent methyltransferase
MSAAAWAAVADALGLGPGMRILDVGCGDGGFCALAAERGAQVSGVDADAAAVARAARLMPGADLRVGLMEALPWADGSFDAVTSFNALQYASDLDLALAEALRVLRPGGRLGVCKWARDNELFALAIAAGAGRPGALRARDPVEAAIARAGLRVSTRAELPVELQLADAAALAAATGVAGADEHAAAFRRPDGSYRFAASLMYVVAET